MFVHYKGPQDNPRTDKYLFGPSSLIKPIAQALRSHDCFDRRLDTR